MQNILSIYKFHFPFLDIKYEKIKKDSFISNLRNFLIYEEVFLKVEKVNRENAEFTTLSFEGGRIEFLYYDYKDYYIPIFQIEVFLEEWLLEFKEKLFHKIFNIVSTIQRQDYIFSIDESFIPHRNNDIISINDLEKNFKSVSQKELNVFLSNLNMNFIEDQIEANPKIKKYFIYLLYLCYIFYYNNLNLESSKKELEEITWNSDFAIYDMNIDFYTQRIRNLSDMNLVNFKKYYKMIEEFFWLFKG